MTTAGNARFYGIIVIGCGGIGSAALYWLSKRTKSSTSILGIEQFKLGHDNGGSQDVSRIIRMVYHDEIYSHLARVSYTAWEEAEKESGEQLVFKTGGLNIAKLGTKGEQVVRQYARTLDQQGVPYEVLEGDQLRQRYPIWTAHDLLAVFQKDSGLVDAARGNSTHIQLAEANGATVLENTTVTDINRRNDGLISVHTNNDAFICGRVIVTAGAWANNVLRSVGLQIPLTVTQEQVSYLRTPNVKECGKSRFPITSFSEDEYEIYIMPTHGNTYSKIGIDAAGPIVTAQTRNFIPDPKRERHCVEFLKRIAPKVVGPKAYTKTCLYAMTPDRDFVIDTCAKLKFPDVILCCGAGHAYKFSAVLGQILADLALDGQTKFNLDRFKLDRPALTNPHFKTDLHFRACVEPTNLKSNL